MCARTNQQENKILTVSALLASGFAVGGLILGLLVGSLVIAFDGVYSLVSLLLTLLSLAVSKFIQTPSAKAFPFGKAVLEPIVIAIKAAVILAVVGYSLHSAVMSLFTGGRDIDISVATLFEAVSVLVCGYAWWFIARHSRTRSSGLIEAEAKQWQMDTLLSAAVMVGFVITWVVTLSPYAEYAAYADPVMMCLMSVYFIKVPFDMLCGALRELMMMSPDEEICSEVDAGVLAVNREALQEIELAGVIKVGRELRVNVDVHTDNNGLIAVDDIERTRRSLARRLSVLPFDLQLNLNIAR